MKKILSLGLAALLMVGALAGCGNNGSSINDTISVLTREEGSGTRGAFIELLGQFHILELARTGITGLNRGIVDDMS